MTEVIVHELLYPNKVPNHGEVFRSFMWAYLV